MHARTKLRFATLLHGREIFQNYIIEGGITRINLVYCFIKSEVYYPVKTAIEVEDVIKYRNKTSIRLSADDGTATLFVSGSESKMPTSAK